MMYGLPGFANLADTTSRVSSRAFRWGLPGAGVGGGVSGTSKIDLLSF